MGNYIAVSTLVGILGALVWIYFSIYFDTRSYVKKVRKYKKLQLFKLKLKRNRRKRLGS